VKALKFLLDGSVGPFSGFAWTGGEHGEPGPWVESEGDVACKRGVHACAPADLPYWLQDELWEVELRGPVVRGRHKLVAPSGRLLRRVEAWDTAARAAFADACLARAGELVRRQPEADGYLADLERFQPHVGPAAIASLAARAAEAVEGRAGYEAERAAQADWLAGRLGLERGVAA
jgi:hypothetical protein